jgi:hypothetical protein
MASDGIYELHFFPGRNELEVRRLDGTIVEKFPAKGEDPARVGEPRWGLTNPGTFFITRIGKHRSTRESWPLSVYTWDETVHLELKTRNVFGWGNKTTPELTLSQEDFDDYYANHPAVLKAIRRGDSFVNVPWRVNDFGHITIKMSPDKNNNGILDPEERDVVSPCFLHTTPQGERAKMNGTEDTYVLTYSHGCIHVKPSDIDTLIEKYIILEQTKMIIYSY